MANHLRRQIREAAATALTGLTTTGARVYQMRVYPLQDAELPGLLIFSKDELAERVTAPRPSIFRRTLEIVVEGYAKANSSLEDTLDGMAKEVEIAIAADPSFAGLAKSTTLRSTETDLQDGAESPVGMVRLVYDCEYFAREDLPDVPS